MVQAEVLIMFQAEVLMVLTTEDGTFLEVLPRGGSKMVSFEERLTRPTVEDDVKDEMLANS